MPKRVFSMTRAVASDGALLYAKSHRRVPYKTGLPLSAKFGKGPIVFELDEELRAGPLPTFFIDPGLIATKQFCEQLRKAGIENLEVRDAILEDPVDQRQVAGYLFLNIVGLVSCADMQSSDSETLGDEIVMINKLVLDSKMIPDLDIFHVAEDTDNLVISERVHRQLTANNYYPDVYFEELKQV